MRYFEHPPTAVIVPFAGSLLEGRGLLDTLSRLEVGARDEVVVVDNSVAGVLSGLALPERTRVVRADRERSSYYARNAGAQTTRHPWLLFLDADCTPSVDLLEAYFRDPLGERCGAQAGAVVGRTDQAGIIARYSNNARILHQETIVRGEWGFGQTANLLVRRAAWDDVGGFIEGIRSAGDADLCWRLRAAGWSIEYCGEATVEHRQRETLRGLVIQVARHAAGSAWLRRRYPESGHSPEPRPRAVAAETRRLLSAVLGRDAETVKHGVLSGLMLVVRLVARLTANRPPGLRRRDGATAELVICVGEFPPEPGAIAGLPVTGDRVHVEAYRRAPRLSVPELRATSVTFREDESPLDRWRAMFALAARSPLRARRWLHDPLWDELLAAAPAAARASGRDAVRVAGIDAQGDVLARDLCRLSGASELRGRRAT